MTYDEARRAIEGRRPAGIQPGLDRMRRALEQLGHPERRLRAVHVAGTNGKGSTARMIQSIATAAGYRTGLFSSPAVTGLRDTITIDGAAISEEDFAAGVEALLRLGDGGELAGSLTEFELTTLLALWHFGGGAGGRGVDLCVVECGMGGLEDATNVFDAPLAAVITPVALDHTAWLGDTIEQIAANKCGIIKPGAAVVTAPGQDTDALGAIWETAARLGLTVRQPMARTAPIVEAAWGRTVFQRDGARYVVPLTGAFQRDNALTALETADCLRAKGFALSEEAVAAGLAGATLPCRQEALSHAPLMLADGAHNPHGVAALAASIRELGTGGPLTLVLGMLADKDAAACAALLAPLCARVVCCAPDNPRALAARTLADFARPYCGEVLVREDPFEALETARASAAGGPLLVAGSFFLAAALRPALLEGRYFSEL